MKYRLFVRPHPLGVVVYRAIDELGELLIPDEDCCGIPYQELERIAKTTREIEVETTSASNCPLRRARSHA